MGNSLRKTGKPEVKLPPAVEDAPAKSAERPYEPGEGIRSMKTSSVFRTLNFELYAKPNKTVMVIGVVSFTLCVGYLTYLNYHYDGNQYYEALAEDGTKILRPKKSRWDS